MANGASGISLTAKGSNLTLFFYVIISSQRPPLSSLFLSLSILCPDQEDLRGHSDHHPGHGDHRGLRCVRVFPPQPVHRVGQVHSVRDLSQQTQHCQAAGQPAGDGAVLLHGERKMWFCSLLLLVFAIHVL